MSEIKPQQEIDLRLFGHDYEPLDNLSAEQTVLYRAFQDKHPRSRLSRWAGRASLVGLASSIVGLAEIVGITENAPKTSWIINPTDLALTFGGLVVFAGGTATSLWSWARNRPIVESEFREAIGLPETTEVDMSTVETPVNTLSIDHDLSGDWNWPS